MSSRHVAIAAILLLPCTALLSGCSTSQRTAPSIAYLDSEYRVCRDNCPQRTPKELDDAADAQPAILASSGPANLTMETPAPLANSAAGSQKKITSAFEVYFDFGMSAPSQAGRRALIRLAERASTQSIATIKLVGETDDIGTKKYNGKLAVKRANFVANWIKTHGINARIAITAKPACCHPAPYDKTELSLAGKRRVTITPEWVQINPERGARDAENLN